MRADRSRESSFICVFSYTYKAVSSSTTCFFFFTQATLVEFYISSIDNSSVSILFAKSCCSRSCASLPALHSLQRSVILYLLLPLILAAITGSDDLLLPRLLSMDLRLLQVQSAPNPQRPQASRTRHLRPQTL